ncbi:Vegetative incompatibility protein HET-E-1 [Fulvia fulva]|uniref:Vegetative incompatibility protein HET-E-1 n=1 Tax=Passalora fulva TaxID=5499 RepID=A0A9Q8L952_PASFU|nr:Vegetative incompatibility protein HET-E-1 [Fulvia fulva]KAK4637113.1 Vegetative incompatibility protein HET-E-1 [Fulvia fulva]UJO12999.1 Vegetative incompatibility protein HET-E-1 [Fulvia fulva]WPV10281.1 Vegetative incompatibility protein HET-E-1 [Fulvia fulva]
MRLLNTHTLNFEEFTAIPAYAILSHRWIGDEVSYDDYCSKSDREDARYDKIFQSCKLARSRKHKYIWIDTCCIDKRSSAELSEAINSMWDWYSSASECFAFLVDVHFTSNQDEMVSRLERSAWFRRGWTLQELLAPRIVTFCTSDWRIIGQKSDKHLLPALSDITSIPKDCIEYQFMLHTKCIAQRLSWAAKRETTRTEDTAYCLLGLVGVNMPLLYGEGDKAFLRLQQEIIRQSDDESIFAWRYVSPPSGYRAGILAPHVSFFSNSHGVRLLDGKRAPYSMTNKGLEIRSDATFVPSVGVYVLPLNCGYTQQLQADAGRSVKCTIVIRAEDGAYYRVAASRLGEHLGTMYVGRETEAVEESTYHIKLSRWQHSYQPAFSLLGRCVIRWRARKGRVTPGESAEQEQTWMLLEERATVE